MNNSLTPLNGMIPISNISPNANSLNPADAFVKILIKSETESHTAFLNLRKGYR